MNGRQLRRLVFLAEGKVLSAPSCPLNLIARRTPRANELERASPREPGKIALRCGGARLRNTDVFGVRHSPDEPARPLSRNRFTTFRWRSFIGWALGARSEGSAVLQAGFDVSATKRSYFSGVGSGLDRSTQQLDTSAHPRILCILQ